MVNCAQNTHTEILFVETLLLEKHIVTFFLLHINNNNITNVLLADVIYNISLVSDNDSVQCRDV